ncbi:MAG: radical SAM protein [Candidatus Diapherotrites archaeon]|nr:radical SAM protein [Candidatus Diapherotrites archaeon]
MRLVFLNPPFHDTTYNREVRFQAVSPQKALHPPLLLAYGTALCKKAGHDVDLIDAPALEITREETIARIKEFRPELIVMLTSTASVESDGTLAKELKKESGGKTIAVGVHATAVPEDTLDKGFDLIARGEYEETILDLANGKSLKTCLGISFKKDGKLIHNQNRLPIQNLDELPFPAREFLPNEKYYSALYKNPFTFILGGRGCPHACIFCAGPQLMSGRAYRFRSARNIVDEMKHIKQNFPALKSVLFNDDTLNVNKKHILELCDLLIKENVNLPWAAYSRTDSVDEEIAVKMKEAGCFLVKVGFESGNDEILKTMKKGPRATAEQGRKCAELFKKAGIQVHGTFVFGMPGETKETIQQTIDYAKSLDIDFVQFSVAQPYPGTEFFNLLKEKGLLKIDKWSDYLDDCGCIAPIFEYPNLSKEDFEKHLKSAYKQYYLRPRYIMKAIRQRMTNKELAKTSFRSGWNLIKYMRN